MIWAVVAFPPKGWCIAPPIIHPMSRFMVLSFAVHTSSSRAKRSTFKAKLNVGLRQSQIGEAATFRIERCRRTHRHRRHLQAECPLDAAYVALCGVIRETARRGIRSR